MRFNNPYNPNFEEIQEWAFAKKELEPVQDWDIIVNWLVYPDLILNLASDDTCPKQDYFQHILYVVVGQAVRGLLNSRSTNEIEVLLSHSENFSHPSITLWEQRCRDILKNSQDFNYDDWFSGRLSKATDS